MISTEVIMNIFSDGTHESYIEDMKAIEENLKMIEELKSSHWEVNLETKCAFCKACDVIMSLKCPRLIINHEKDPIHQKKLKALHRAEDEKELDQRALENIEEAFETTLGIIDDHPKFLHANWSSIQRIMAIVKMDLAHNRQIKKDFKLVGDPAKHDIVFEIIKWLDE